MYNNYPNTVAFVINFSVSEAQHVSNIEFPIYVLQYLGWSLLTPKGSCSNVTKLKNVSKNISKWMQNMSDNLWDHVLLEWIYFLRIFQIQEFYFIATFTVLLKVIHKLHWNNLFFEHSISSWIRIWNEGSVDHLLFSVDTWSVVQTHNKTNQ